MRTRWLAAVGGLIAVGTVAAQPPSPTLPEAAGKDTVQKVCGACHPATVVLGRGMTREGWDRVVASMITRGAKGTPAEFSTVVDYLTTNFPVGSAESTGSAPKARHSDFQAGSADRQDVDTSSAERGKPLYATHCEDCHGPQARGGSKGPDLVRSTRLLHDRYGNVLGPYLTKYHPAVDGKPIAQLNDSQLKDLVNFLHQQMEDTLRSGPYTKVLNVLTGNANAGAAYFNGGGGCTGCHSVTGDLAGIASKYDAPTLQQRILFPRTVVLQKGTATTIKPTTVTVTGQDGKAVSGSLVRIDDFNVALRDTSDRYHTWKRTRELKVQVNDPYATHEELLDKISDTDVHNLVAYLETLK